MWFVSSQTRDVELALWDIQDMTKPVALQTLGNATGLVVVREGELR